MTYKRGYVFISVHQTDGFGTYPALWIGTSNTNQMIKVASFGSEAKARQFCKWLDYMFGIIEEESVKWE